VAPACEPPLETPRPITTVTPANNTTQVAGSLTVAASTPSASSDPQLKIEHTLQVITCTCKGEVRKIMLTIKPVGGASPYSFSVDPYLQLTEFDDVQNFEVYPGSILTINVYSSDSQKATKVVSVPSTCDIPRSCGGNQQNVGPGVTSIPPSQPPPDPTPIVTVCIPPNPNSNKCKDK